MTNFEKIKRMTAEEFSNFLHNIITCCYSRGYSDVYGCSYSYADYECSECSLRNAPCQLRGELEKWLESEAETE